MRILVLSERFPPEGSGGPLATYLLLKELVKDKNFSITVLTEAKNPWIIPGVKYIRLLQLAGKNKYSLLFKQLTSLMNNEVAKIIRRHDIIYVADHSYIFIFLARKLNKPILVHLHDYFPISSSSVILEDKDVTKYFKLLLKRMQEALDFEVIQSRPLSRGVLSSCTYPLHFLLASLALTMANKIISVSKIQSHLLIRHIPWIKDKVKVIYNPPPPIRFMGKPLSSRPLFLYLGGASTVKGFHLIVKTILKHRSRINNYRIMMTGVDPAKIPKWYKWNLSSLKTLKKIVMMLHKLNSVKVVGWIDRKELLSYFKHAWSLLFPSIWYEPLPYAVLEACMAGRIPIVSMNTGFSELAYGTSAEKYLLKKNTPAEIADRIEEVSAMSQDDILDKGSKLREEILAKVSLSKIIKSFKKEIYEVAEASK